MECLKLQHTLVWKYARNWTRKGWPTARMRTSFLTSDTNSLCTSLRANTSLLELWPPVDFYFANMTLPNAPLPKCSTNFKSPRQKPLSSLWRPVTQPLEQIYQITVYILLTFSGVPRIFFGGGGFNKFSWGQRTERTGIWGRSPLVRGSGGSCNLVQEMSFHIVKLSSFLVF